MDNWHRDDAVHEYVDENGNICYGTYEEAREHLEREQEELARRLAGELDDDNDYYEDEEAEEEPLKVSPHAQELADLLSTVLMGNVELQDALETSLREAKRNPDLDEDGKPIDPIKETLKSGALSKLTVYLPDTDEAQGPNQPRRKRRYLSGPPRTMPSMPTVDNSGVGTSRAHNNRRSQFKSLDSIDEWDAQHILNTLATAGAMPRYEGDRVQPIGTVPSDKASKKAIRKELMDTIIEKEHGLGWLHPNRFSERRERLKTEPTELLQRQVRDLGYIVEFQVVHREKKKGLTAPKPKVLINENNDLENSDDTRTRRRYKGLARKEEGNAESED